MWRLCAPQPPRIANNGKWERVADSGGHEAPTALARAHTRRAGPTRAHDALGRHACARRLEPSRLMWAVVGNALDKLAQKLPNFDHPGRCWPNLVKPGTNRPTLLKGGQITIDFGQNWLICTEAGQILTRKQNRYWLNFVRCWANLENVGRTMAHTGQNLPRQLETTSNQIQQQSSATLVQQPFGNFWATSKFAWFAGGNFPWRMARKFSEEQKRVTPLFGRNPREPCCGSRRRRILSKLCRSSPTEQRTNIELQSAELHTT